MKSRFLLPLLLCLSLLIHCSDKTPQKPANGNGKSEHFECVLHDDLSPSITTDILNKLESNYQRILADLQVEEMPMVTVEIWANNINFLEAMEKNIGVKCPGATGYITASALCLLYAGDVPQTAVHEFAHLVTMQVNIRIPNNPRWLWEAVALYEAGDFVHPATLPYMVAGDYPTLVELNREYNSSDHKIYSVGYTIGECIVRTWGRGALIDLIKTNGDIAGILGLSIKEFEDRWYLFVKDTYLGYAV
ncbi:hypothetical protein JXO59_09950 [candidate division KSB1 bacterium]|nr:hypothetical protein [candidate division KSB1 bacterium]